MATQTLKDLRVQVREVDSELIRLLARRLGLVRKIGLLKQQLRAHIVDPATERIVTNNFVKSASAAGVDTALAKRIANLIIESSVETQKSMQLSESEEASRERVAIIGAGGMGSWFAQFFKSRGFHIVVSDRDKRKAKHLASKIHIKWCRSNIEAARGSDIIVLATPTSVTSRIIEELLPVLKENSLLVDICAVKSSVKPALLKAEKQGVHVASIHPMFGPQASGLRGRRVIMVESGRVRGGSRRLKQLLEGSNISVTNQQNHDRQTALTLALPHFLNMAFALTISKRNIADVRKFAGRTFDLQLTLAEDVASEPETTADIQTLNKEFQPVLRDLQANINLLARTVNRRKRSKLIAQYRQVRDNLKSDPKFRSAHQAFERASQAVSP